MRARVLVLTLAICFSLPAAGQTYATIVGSNIPDAGGNALASGQLCFTPVDSHQNPIAFRAAGQTTSRAVCMDVVNGVITPPSGSYQLANTQTTYPSPICYSATLTDSADGSSIYPPQGYTCVQMNSNWCTTTSGVMTCDWDNYPPSSTAQAPVQAPTLAIGTVSTLTPGSSATASFSGTAPNFTLSLGLPQGYAGLGSDSNCGANGSGVLNCIALEPLKAPYAEATNPTYGMVAASSAAATANTTALNADVAAVANTGVLGYGVAVHINPGYYYMGCGVDLRDVNLDGGYGYADSSNDPVVTLDFSSCTSGTWITNYAAIRGIAIVAPTGGFTPGNAVHVSGATFTLSSGGIGVVTVSVPSATWAAIPSTPGPPVLGTNIHVEDSSHNFDGVFRVASTPALVSGNYQFKVQAWMLKPAATSTGVGFWYWPTVALQHVTGTQNPTGSGNLGNLAACCDTELEDDVIANAGTAIDMSAPQAYYYDGTSVVNSGVESNDAKLDHVFIYNSLEGIVCLGDGAAYDLATSGATRHKNCSLNYFGNIIIQNALDSGWFGPDGADEEGGDSGNTFYKWDVESCDTLDATVVHILHIGGGSDAVERGTYGCFVGSGQSTPGIIDTSKGIGGNIIRGAAVSGTRNSSNLLMAVLASDQVDQVSGAAMALASRPGLSVSGSVTVNSGGTTPAPTSVTCIPESSGSCTGTAQYYSLVCNTDANGGHLQPSAAVQTGTSAGGFGGPTIYGTASADAYVAVRVAPDSRCLTWTVLLYSSGTYYTLSGLSNIKLGSPNYFSDASGSAGAAYTTTSDTSGSFNVSGGGKFAAGSASGHAAVQSNDGNGIDVAPVSAGAQTITLYGGGQIQVSSSGTIAFYSGSSPTEAILLGAGGAVTFYGNVSLSSALSVLSSHYIEFKSGSNLLLDSLTSQTCIGTNSSGYVQGGNCVSAIATPGGTPTYVAGTNITSCAQASGYTNTNSRGELTIVAGSSASTGTICTVDFSATLSGAPGLCKVSQNGGSSNYSIGHGTASTTGFTITAGISVASATVTVDYECIQ